jgi:hypothetical protein
MKKGIVAPVCLPDPPNDKCVFLDIPGYKQVGDNTCGVAAGLMVLHAIDKRRSAKKFYDLCNPTEEFGVGSGKLITALRASSVQVSVKRDLGLGTIDSTLRAGYPIITTVKYGKSDLHWVVIFGCDLWQQKVWVADSTADEGYRELDFTDFHWKEWEPQGYGLACRG